MCLSGSGGLEPISVFFPSALRSSPSLFHYAPSDFNPSPVIFPMRFSKGSIHSMDVDYIPMS
jgi:hypothetical protein